MNSKQKEFDIVVNHLFTQGRPALKNGSCAYRGENNTMCAVGCRIPDSRYTQQMDAGADGDGAGFNLHSLVRRFGKRLRKELDAYSDMFLDLQMVHDSVAVRDKNGTFNKDELAHRLEMVARRNNLEFTRPQ